MFLTAIFKYFGLQTLIENIIRSQEIKVFTRTMRQLVCMMDEWDGLTMDDIRRMEDEAKQKLDEMIKSEAVSYTRLTLPTKQVV